MKFRWDKLGGQLGILYCVVGLFLIFLGWNGAASYDRVEAQIPYLISGGLAGVALAVIGSAMIIVYGNRSDRAALQASLEDLRDSLERSTTIAVEETEGAGPAPAGPANEVLAGSSAYHRPTCKLVEGQAGLTAMTAAAAVERGLEPCRICNP
jgi:hypothetical protein